MSPEAIREILDAILALIEEIRVTGTVSSANLAGVKALVGNFGGCKSLDVESLAVAFAAQIPGARAVEQAYENAKRVTQADMRYEVGERPAEAPSEDEIRRWVFDAIDECINAESPTADGKTVNALVAKICALRSGAAAPAREET